VPAGRQLVGVEAVIDKDLASALLAKDIGANALAIVTDVDAVYDGWGTPEQRAIRRATPEALSGSEFAAGSMGPKVRAACCVRRRDRRHCRDRLDRRHPCAAPRRSGHDRYSRRGRRRARAGRMTPRPPSLLDAVLPVVVLIVLIALTIWLFGISATDGPLQVALLLSSAFASLIAFKNGYTVSAVADAAVRGVSAAMSAIFILLAVGALIGTWNMAGRFRPSSTTASGC
jgi:hypothetical protein